MTGIATMSMKLLHFWDKHGSGPPQKLLASRHECCTGDINVKYRWVRRRFYLHSRALWSGEQSAAIPMC